MNPNVPCLVLSRRLMKEVQLASDRFARNNKYTYGAEVRSLTMKVWTLCSRAYMNRAQRGDLISQAAIALADLKPTLQLGADINAFSIKKYEELWRLADDLGKQIGGWSKRHPIGQNPAVQRTAPPERASILSTPAASAEATR